MKLQYDHTHDNLTLLKFASYVLLLLVSPIISNGQATKIAEQYSFNLGVTYKMDEGKASKKGENLVTMWLSNKPYFGMEMGRNNELFMVTDMNTGKSVTLMNEQKMAMVMDLKKMMQQVANSEKVKEEAANTKIQKTGKTEKILGYTCSEFVMTTSDGTSRAWITTELGSGMTNYLKSMFMMLPGKSKQAASWEKAGNGVLLRLESTNKKNEVTRMEATEVKKANRVVSTRGFTVMGQ